MSVLFSRISLHLFKLFSCFYFKDVFVFFLANFDINYSLHEIFDNVPCTGYFVVFKIIRFV